MRSLLDKALSGKCGAYGVEVEARLVRSHVFAGVIHLTTTRDGESLVPPVTIIVPGQWPSEAPARDAAAEYVTVMAEDGALEQAIALRRAA